MKKCLLSKLLIFNLIFFFTALNAQGPFKQKRTFKLPKGIQSKDYLPNVVIVKFKETKVAITNAKNIAALKTMNVKAMIPMFSEIKSKGAKIAVSDQQYIDKNGLDRIYEIDYQDDKPIEDVINKLLEDVNVEYAEPSYIYYTSYTPNDPSFSGSNQDYLRQVKANAAWDIQRNANGVIIAIVDSGSDLEHEDLAANISLNTADPINGIDDDRDGYIDNYRGWDLVGATGSSFKEDNDPDIKADSLDHGVHVSGLASAVTDNGRGMASIAQNAKLLIVKVGADNNERAIYRGYEGIVYAANHGATIINCSWGGPGYSNFGQETINYAVSKGCLVVVAAGNSGTDEIDYPAGYKGAFAVANVTGTDVKSSSSSYGYHVAISAPGTNIYSTINRNLYGFKSGTSMATPIVSSAAALLKAKFPALTGLQIGEMLRLSSDDINALPGNSRYINKLGKGRLNIEKAFSAANLPSVRNQFTTINDKARGSFAIGDTLQCFFDLKNILQSANGLGVSLAVVRGNVQILNPTISVGTLASLETRKIGPFKVIVNSTAADNELVVFSINYTANSGAYTDKEFFEIKVNLDYQNIVVNQVSTTITSNGRVGYSVSDATNGLGFNYKNEAMLYEASLMIGTSATSVSNNTRIGNGESSEDFVKKARVAEVKPTTAAYEGVAEFSDANSTKPLNVTVKNRQIAFKNTPDDKFVIIEYEIINKTTSPINNLYTGLFTDWDIDIGSNNLTKYDGLNNLAYTYSLTANSPYAAVKVINNKAPIAYYPMSYQLSNDLLRDDNFTIADKYETLSSGIKSNSLGGTNGLDVMHVTGTGPYTVPAGGSIKVAYAFIGGDNLPDIQKTAKAAEDKYSEFTGNEPLDPDGDKLVLDQNYPNPVGASSNNTTTISFNIPKKGSTTLKIYDILGREIMTVFNADVDTGKYNLQVNLSALQNGIYLYQIINNGEKQSKKIIINR